MVIKKKIMLLLLLVFSMKMLIAQDKLYAIKGSISKNDISSIVTPSITLVNNEITHRAMFSAKGEEFNFYKIDSGYYILTIKSIGFKTYKKEIYINQDTILKEIIQEKDTLSIDEVFISRDKKLLQRKPNGFILNIDNSSFQSNNLLDIFQILPFIEVNDDKIRVKGKTNIIYFIDNVQIPKNSISQTLKSIAGNNIDRIEFITNPQSKYDSSSDIVIIIHTKKEKNNGVKSGVILNYSKGKYDQNNIYINSTYRKNRLGLSARYGFNTNNRFKELGGYRILSSPLIKQIIDRNNTEFYDQKTHSFNLNLEYKFSRNHILNLNMGFENMNTSNSELTNKSTFRVEEQKIDSILITKQKFYLHNNMQNYSLNYVGKLDTSGSTVSFTTTYTPIRIKENSEILTQNMYSNDNILISTLPIIKNINPTNADIFVIQNDWTTIIKKKWIFEAGFKYSYSKNKTSIYQLQNIDDKWIEISDFTSVNNMYENIFAGYLVLQKEFGKTNINASIRGENTNMGIQHTYKRTYFNLFPQLKIQRSFGTHTISLGYRKSINRPSYNEVSPWRFYIDEYFLLEGNPSLRPTYSNIISLEGNLISNLFITLEYNKQKDIFVQLSKQKDNITISQPTNINGLEKSISFDYNYNPAKWWEINTSLRAYYWEYNGLVNQSNILKDGYAYTFGILNRFNIYKSLNINLTYKFNSKNGYAGEEYLSNNYARIAVQKSFFNKRLNITLAANDIFKGQVYRTKQVSGNFNNYSTLYNDTRRVSFGLSYSFGRSSINKLKEKELGNEDLIERVK